MGTDVALFEGKMEVPAFLKNVGVDSMTKSLAGSGGSGKQLSIRGKVWRMISGGQEVATTENPSINVVIVAASEHTNRMYYASAYKEGEVKSPDCWSVDGKTPDEKATSKQSERCDICPQNIKGSGARDSRACRFSRRIAVVMEQDIGGTIYRLTVPAASLFGDGEKGQMPLQLYAKHLMANKIPMNGVVTEMRFDKDSSVPKLFFRGIRPLNSNEYDVIIEQGQHPDAIAAITLDIQPIEEEEKSEPVVVEPPKATKPNPFAKQEKKAEPAEPTKKVKETPPVTDKKSQMASILDEFED